MREQEQSQADPKKLARVKNQHPHRKQANRPKEHCLDKADQQNQVS